MTDKEKKSKIADILMDFQEEYSNEVINRPMLASLYAGNILSFIDSLQEEPVNKNYRERYKRIAQSEAFKRTHEGMSVGEIMHVEGEECISEIDFGQELYKAFGQVKDFTLGLQIAKRFYDMGKNHQEPISEQNLSNVERIGKDWKEEPISEDFKKFEVQYLEKEEDEIFSVYDRHAGLVDGAQWQKEQFEKNRLAACDRQTEEEAEMERDFCMGIIENEHRQPTFDDAIKYGMRLQKKQMMAKAIDAQCFGFQDAALFSFRLPVGNYLVGSEVKVIVIKED